MKLLLRLGLVVLLATAVYFRLLRHDAAKYYLLFIVWIAVLAIYLFRYGTRSN